MEKNFLNITPESGNGNQEVTVNAKANVSLEDREETLRIRSSTGKEASVRITQDGVPFMAHIGVVPRNIFPASTGHPTNITFLKTTWDSEGIPTTELKVANSDERELEFIPYFQLLIRKDIADELLPPGEYGNPAMYIQDALLDQSLTGIGISFNQITIKGIEYYTAAIEGSYYKEDFHASIGLCYEYEEVELFRLCTQRFDIHWF
jgi:hypothetical protein